jgi:hypothetical protein
VVDRGDFGKAQGCRSKSKGQRWFGAGGSEPARDEFSGGEYIANYALLLKPRLKSNHKVSW